MRFRPDSDVVGKRYQGIELVLIDGFCCRRHEALVDRMYRLGGIVGEPHFRLFCAASDAFLYVYPGVAPAGRPNACLVQIRIEPQFLEALDEGFAGRAEGPHLMAPVQDAADTRHDSILSYSSRRTGAYYEHRELPSES